MYVHAYQSYVWNAIVSERIRTYGSDKPIAGDLVFDTNTQDKEEDQSMAIDDEMPIDDGAATADPGMALYHLKRTIPHNSTLVEGASSARSQKKSRKPWVPPSVKTLIEEDLDKYSIFDVIMPLPGKDVAYPGGQLGERYREYLRVDGLDPDNFVRKQK
jgi:tRNA pseudouridine13 synthase